MDLKLNSNSAMYFVFTLEYEMVESEARKIEEMNYKEGGFPTFLSWDVVAGEAVFYKYFQRKLS